MENLKTEEITYIDFILIVLQSLLTCNSIVEHNLVQNLVD